MHSRPPRPFDFDEDGNEYLYDMVFSPPPPDPNIIVDLRYLGKFGVWGCATDWGFGPPKVPKIPLQCSVPPEAEPFIRLEELNDVASRANDIMENNYLPILPTLCSIFCCLEAVATSSLLHYHNERDKQLNQMVTELNSVYLQRCCCW